MEVFKPFCAHTYFKRFEKSNNFSRFVCPYNFNVNFKESEQNLIKNEHNVFNFKEDLEGKSKLKSWIDGSILVSNKTPSFYVYEISYKIFDVIYSLVGVVGALKLPEEGEKEYLKLCEETLKEEVQFNLNFLKNSSFSSSPVCAMYDEEQTDVVSNLIRGTMASSYIFKAKQNNVLHKVWEINEEESLNILKEFFKDKVYYVVCGTEKLNAAVSHKKEAGENLKFNDKNYVMAFLFQKKASLTLLPVHRVVSGIEMFDGEEILKKASEKFNITKCKTLDSMRKTLFNFKRNNENAFGFYADDCYSVLSLKEANKEKSPHEMLDVFVVDKLFLDEILNVKGENVNYSYLDKAASFCVDCGDACFAIFLNAIRSEEFFNIVNLKEKLPVKSFNFFPKSVEGLLFYVY